MSRSNPRGTNIWLKQLPAGPLTPLTRGPATDMRPSWSGDGQSVVFLSNRVDPDAVFALRVDGTGTARLLAQPGRALAEATESLDGRWLVASTSSAEPDGADILAMAIGRDSALKPILATPANETNPTLSPDGRWLAYVSTDSARREVYVRPFPAVLSAVWQISMNGGGEPLWSHSGNELFFRSANGHDMMAVSVRTAPVFHAEAPRVLFKTNAVTGIDYRRYDVSPDDRRFLMVVPSKDNQQSQLIRVENLVYYLTHRKTP